MNSLGLLGGRYEVRDVLGFGATAEVCDGWDTRLNRPVAIKLLHRGLSAQADVRQRFETEARAAAALNHPNIVRVYDIGDDDETPFIVMERLPGDTLGDRIALGPLPQAEVCAALGSVLSALAVAHDAGMLHRDIKPGNILLTSSASVKVADFGIVKTAASVHTTTGHVVGTLAYMSPDRVAGKPASIGDDLYAAGVLGYEALTGRKPFAHEDIMPLAHAIIEGSPTPLNELRPDIDPALADVIERAMSRDPLQRFSSADAMASALSGHTIQQVSSVSVSSDAGPPTLWRSARRHPPAATVVPLARDQRSPNRGPKLVGSAALLAALAVTALAFSLFPSSTKPPAAPGSFSSSTPVPSPVGVPELPLPTAQAVPPLPPPVAVLAPAPSAVLEKATNQEPRGAQSSPAGVGIGNSDNGNGVGNIRYGSGNGSSAKTGDREAGNTNRDDGNNGKRGNGNNGNGNGNGNNGNGNGNGNNGNGGGSKPK